MTTLLTIALLLAAQPDASPIGVEDAGAAGDAAGSSQFHRLLDEILEGMASEQLELAQQQLASGDEMAALRTLQEAHEIAPLLPELNLQLGLLLQRLERLEEAAGYLSAAAEHETLDLRALLALADVLLADQVGVEPLLALAEQLGRASIPQRAQPELVLRQARVAARLLDDEQASRHYAELATLESPSETLCLELGDYHRRHDRLDQAVHWYRKIGSESSLRGQAQERIWQVEVLRQALRYGWSLGAEEVPHEAQLLCDRGRDLLALRRHGEAVRVLRRAVSLAPQFSQARWMLGDALRGQGRRDAAELEYLRGLAFDHGSAELHARLGQLYLEHVDQDRAAEAVVLLARGLQLRPDWTGLQLSLAQAHRRSGNFPLALAAVQRFLASDPPEVDRPRALALQDSLQRLLGTSGVATPTDAAPRGEAILQRVNRARALLSRGETGAAVAALQELLAEESGPRIRQLEGRILHAAGQLEQAADAFRASLEKLPGQAEVHTHLGVVLLAMGQTGRAIEQLQRAEQLGDLDAAFYLARHSLRLAFARKLGPWTQPRKLFEARRRLRHYIERHPHGAHHKEASELLERVDRSVQQASLWALLLMVLAGLVLVGTQRWRARQVDLELLLTLHPETGPEVQRILSAIRHEVLKHNTKLIDGLIDAIEQDLELESRSQLLQHLLRGSDSSGGTLQQFQAYAGQLRQLARHHGLNLRLRDRDRALAPLHRGFQQLEQLEPALRRAAEMAEPDRRRLASALRAAGSLLNTQAYREVELLLDRLRSLDLDQALLLSVFERVRREPALAALRVAPLELDLLVELPLRLGLPRSELEAVLGNLIRNALQASAASGQDPIKLGVQIAVEANPVTGHEWVAIRVRDRAERGLTTTFIEEREVTSGLGLARETIKKYDGFLQLRDLDDDWKKEIVVGIPLIESTDQENADG